MSPDIRILSADADLLAASRTFHTSLVAFPGPPDGELDDFFEPGRTLGAVVGGQIVATATSMTSWIVVPGGRRVSHCAVTDIGVLPTHTRRGLAGALVRRQFADAAARGEVIATLRASEAVIYERFGYGIATFAASIEVALARAALRPTAPPGGPVRLVAAKDSWDVLARIYPAAGWTGAIDRPAYWWTGSRYVAEKKSGPSYVVVHGDEGAEDGYARYHPIGTDDWFSQTRDRTIVVDDLIAHTERARLGLIRFLLSIDLLQRVDFRTMAVDDSLADLLLDHRAARTTSIRDETWLRLIDVPRALAARSYHAAGSVTIGVEDAEIPDNSGNYVINAVGARRTDAGPDVSLDVAALASLYLGGTRWRQLARAGRVVEHSPGALAVADALFATDRAPFAGTWF